MTLTIEIPDMLLDRAAAGFAPAEVSRFAVAGAVTAVTAAADNAEFHPDEDALEAVVAAGHKAIADIEAGLLLTIEQADASLPSRLAEAVARQRRRVVPETQ